MSQYQSFPTGPGDGSGGYGGPPTKGARPKSADLAVKLIWVSIALGVLGAVLSFATIGSQLEDQGLDPDAARIGLIVGIVFGLVIGVGIPVLLAVFIGKGANWARIVYTVLAVISILGGLVGLIGTPPLLLVLNLVGLVLSIAIVVLLFRPDSNAWFSAR